MYVQSLCIGFQGDFREGVTNSNALKVQGKKKTYISEEGPSEKWGMLTTSEVDSLYLD